MRHSTRAKRTSLTLLLITLSLSLCSPAAAAATTNTSSSSSRRTTKRDTAYTIYQDWTGQNFFKGWNFAGTIDSINWGSVKWLDEADARYNNLIGITDSGTAIVKADNSTVLPAGLVDGQIVNRNSISMSSQATFGVGSLVLFSARHMPYGCSVWPGFWSLGGDAANWPQFGEIDIVESINMATNNAYSLHTTGSCMHPNSTENETGRYGPNTDCHNTTLSNTGCVVTETKADNYGTGFAQNGGGAYALEWTEDAMSFWFFPRQSIPADFASQSPDPSGWGTPGGYFPSSYCNWNDHFGPQSIQIDIDICGLWAGDQGTFTAGGLCTGKCTDLVHNPKNYDNAYFEFDFVRIFVAQGSTEPTLTLSPIGINGPAPTGSGASRQGSAAYRSSTIAGLSTSLMVGVGALAGVVAFVL